MGEYNRRTIFSRAAENGVFWMMIFLGTLGFLSLFSAGRQAIQTGSGKMRTLAEGRNHKTSLGLLPICSVETGSRQAALTFEVGNGGEGLEKVLEILKENQVKASFFLSGSWAVGHLEEMEALARAGHDLGNMGQAGKGMEGLALAECRQEISQAHQAISQITGQELNLFCPAGGVYDDTLVTAACAVGYYPVKWNVDSLDWKDYGSEQIIKQVLGQGEIEEGSIIHFRCQAKYMPEALPEIIRRLREDGYELVPLSRILIPDHYHLDEGGRAFSDGEEGK